ncbi:hypothetical protein CO038_02750 [Candidatus Pacearchaeota archaeon CG_4_9_14_0_2_um_filter_39_13]|nr:NUDIX hydrolase [Candidatus Pacearchaeota archaeon]OIO43096.1 MAG: hypothetical protein AUJ64_02845 [Candidatus Pacearchaeota archaeon CG1_02_39_14]PJC44636.1 MAG: hypothetical protein CO038_02750 [Candidatus Pacearchaeota archaeon CG_4_9_14_0_2_um_filter_39_13]
MKDKIIAFLMNFMRVEVAVAGIIEDKGKIFLTKRNRALVEGGKWCLPGGHVDKWERAEDAMKRELKEETGLDARSARLLFVHEEFDRRLNLHAIVFIYKLSVKGKAKKSWEVKESRWFTRKEIEKMNMAFTHSQMLDKYWKMKK